MERAVMLCREHVASQKSKLEHNSQCDTGSKLLEWGALEELTRRAVSTVALGTQSKTCLPTALPTSIPCMALETVSQQQANSMPAAGQQQICRGRLTNVVRLRGALAELPMEALQRCLHPRGQDLQ